MDEDLATINSSTRNEKIKIFLLNNKKKIIIFLSIILLILLSFFGFKELKHRQKIKVSNLYNSTILDFSKDNKDLVTNNLIKIIEKKDPTYSPLSLFYIIDNDLILDKKKINELFDILINKTSLETEIKFLLIYKKGLFNADFADENELLDILKPIINSKSVWRSHALYLLAEYFYSKNQTQKSKEFYNQILTLENANLDIVKETQKRLSRDLSE